MGKMQDVLRKSQVSVGKMENIHGKCQTSMQKGLDVHGFCKISEKKLGEFHTSLVKSAGCPWKNPPNPWERCRVSIGYSKHPWGKVQNIHGKFQTSTQKVQDIHGYQQKSMWKAQISVENSYRSIRIVQDAHRRCQIPTRQAPQHHQNPTQMISSQHHAFLTPPSPLPKI